MEVPERHQGIQPLWKSENLSQQTSSAKHCNGARLCMPTAYIRTVTPCIALWELCFSTMIYQLNMVDLLSLTEFTTYWKLLGSPISPFVIFCFFVPFLFLSFFLPFLSSDVSDGDCDIFPAWLASEKITNVNYANTSTSAISRSLMKKCYRMYSRKYSQKKINTVAIQRFTPCS